MSVGVVMLVHTALERAAQVARHWSDSGCPVVIHVDKRVSRSGYASFVAALDDLPDILFSERHRCEWGTWSLVAASQTASALMLARFAQVQHVYLASGSCLPLRPVSELIDYLSGRPRTDFIESATIEDVPWTTGGLDAERFTLRFPLSWKRHRRAFDAYVALQRKLRIKRRMPEGLVPHLGSQWWCLTRQTLTAILEDPDREIYDRYFSRVWIPDESYYQTLVRLYSDHIESRSLTLSKFDFEGKPHVFYDDHLQLLRRSDCFVARKIWPHAHRLYDSFLAPGQTLMHDAEPNPGKIDRIFSKAVERRTKGRPGLYMQSRFPRWGHEQVKTCAPYSVFEGFSDLFENFDLWLSQVVNARVHGHLFAPGDVQFHGGGAVFTGALSHSGDIRDYNAKAFLTSLIWNTRGERQCFQFSPRDNQEVTWLMAEDPNAQISVITGTWALALFRSKGNFDQIRKEAARLQRIENDHMQALQSPHARARVRVWSMADFIESPMEPLQSVLDEIGPRATQRISEAPKMVDLNGFGRFLQNLKNQGMHPYSVGDYPMTGEAFEPRQLRRRAYVVKS